MNQTDYTNLLNSSYTREELCYIILSCLEIIKDSRRKNLEVFETSRLSDNVLKGGLTLNGFKYERR